MHLSLATEFMQCLGSDIEPKSDTYALANCPLAEWRHENKKDSHPSFRVSLGSKKSWGKCYACNWKGPLGDLLMELQARKATDVDYKTAYEIIDKEWAGLTIEISLDDSKAQGPQTVPFPESLLNSYPRAINCTEAMEYLTQVRRMPVEAIEAWDLRWDGSRKRVCFPIRDEDGTFVGLHGRTTVGEEPKYLAYTYQKKVNHHILLGADRMDVDRPVVVAESVFDAARVWQCYRNVVTPRTASLDAPMLKQLGGIFHLILVFDPDKAGDRAVSEIIKARPKSRITTVVQLPKMKDADALGAQALAPLLKDALGMLGQIDAVIDDFPVA